MQTSNHNVNISGSQPTIIQVAKNNSNATLIQNGQHLLIGKLDQNNANSSNENQSVNGTNNNMQSIYPLQYIETAVSNVNTNQADGNNTSVYGGGGQKIFYQESNHSNIYTSMSGQTPTIIPASVIQARELSGQLSAAVGSAVHIQGTPHAQIVHHGGNAYLVQSSTRLDDESPNMSHTTKASPVTVQWLCENYETADGVSLPRSTLYNHYLQHCQQEKLEPMNQASFGKLIRSVFFGLRTRRLGTRGNSKYHYYGIRIKPNSVLNHYVEDQTFALRQYPSFNRPSHDNELHWRNRYGASSYIGNNNPSSASVNSGTLSGIGTSNSGAFTLITNGANTLPDTNNSNTNQHSSYLGESSSALPNLSEIMTRAELDTLTEADCSVEGVSLNDINTFCHLYLEHSEVVLSSVVYLNFKFIESLWQNFWRTSSTRTGGQSPELEEKLPKIKLVRLLRLGPVRSFMQLFDNMFYQSLVEVLIPNVLRPIPSALTQNIRHFAKSLEAWMSAATVGLHSEVVHIKMSCVCSLAQTLRRHTSLNHLAQAARAVLKNAGQISQMLTDLNRVDFGNVQEQASWVCGCDSKRVDDLQHHFKRILQQQASLEEWAVWLDNVVTDVLEPYRDSKQYPHAAHQFILKWSFYSSMVIRDLTLRSAASFGSFHLIRLLYDEYIFYLVEQKVADHLNLTPVAVTGEMGRQLMSDEYGSYGQVNIRQDMEDKVKYKLDRHQLGKKEECDESQSSYDNSNAMADEQVDESVDDDEGLDEEECQLEEQMSTGAVALCASAATLKAVPASGGHVPVVVVSKTEGHAAPASHKTPASASTASTSSASTVRKTVNVTTFGDHSQPSVLSDAGNASTPPRLVSIVHAHPAVAATIHTASLKLSPSVYTATSSASSSSSSSGSTKPTSNTAANICSVKVPTNDSTTSS